MKTERLEMGRKFQSSSDGGCNVQSKFTVKIDIPEPTE